jgi:hypothetical protein
VTYAAGGGTTAFGSTPANGAANTANGGAGGTVTSLANVFGGNGGSGIVIIRYLVA